MSGAVAKRGRKSIVGRLSGLLILALAAVALLAPADASAQIPPQTWPGHDYCDYKSAPTGKFRVPEGGYSYLNIAITPGLGAVGAEMFGTSATDCLSPASPRCTSNCTVRVQTVCEFHCQHDHNAPYAWTVQLFPTGGHLLRWDAGCVPYKDVPQNYCIVKMPVNGNVNASATFGAAPDPTPPTPAPAVTASGVGSYWMTVSWTPSNDETWLGGYKVMNGATELARAAPTTTSVQLQALRCQTTYNLQVVAFDAANNTPSAPVPVTTGRCLSAGGDTRPPNTVFHVKPPKVTRSRTASFHWGANEPSRFRCKLDRQSWRKCARSDRYRTSMGKTYRRLKRGYHTFRVRAIDRAGNRERRPAVYRWRIR